MARREIDRRDDREGFVLHGWPYKETSLLVEAFTREEGRIAMVARGAKRPRSELHGVLQAFQPVSLSWYGAGELKTLLRAEWRGGLPLLSGSALLCGFYLNELLLKLLPRADFVLVTLPVTPATRHILGARELDAMKPGAGLVNFGRAAVIDYEALRVRLESGRIGGAVLDVFDPEPPPVE